MCSGCGVDHKAFNVRHVGKKRKNLEAVNKLVCFLLTALDLKGKNRCTTVREILFVKCVIGMIGQGRMVDLFYLRMLGQKFNDLFGILCVSFKTERQCFRSLQKKERRKGRNGCTRITKQDRTDVGHKCRRASRLYKGHTVIGRVGIRNCGILARSRPIKLARVNDDTAERCAMSANELGCGMYHDIRTVFNGTDKVRSTECVVYHKRQTVLVGKLCQCVNVGNVAVRVTESFNIDGSCVILDCRLDLGKIVNVYERCRNTEIRKGMSKKIIASTVNGLLRHNVTAILTECLQGVGNRRRTRSES